MGTIACLNNTFIIHRVKVGSSAEVLSCALECLRGLAESGATTKDGGGSGQSKSAVSKTCRAQLKLHDKVMTSDFRLV